MPRADFDMRRDAVHARRTLAYELHVSGTPVDAIREMVGFKNVRTVYHAIKVMRELASSAFSNRRFGVEIEFTGVTRDDVSEVLSRLYPEINFEVQDYNHRVQAQWKLITDSSVSSRGNYQDGEGCEMVSPILQGERGMEELRKVLEAIRQAGGVIDSTCGLHVHHDANDMDAEQLAFLLKLYMENQTVIDRFLAKARRSTEWNRWCQPWQREEKEVAIQRAKGDRMSLRYFDRYRTINVTSYPKYGSIEFRQHQGTLNFKKIDGWVRFGQAMAEASMKVADGVTATPVFETPAAMVEWLMANGKLSTTTAEWLNARAAYYDNH